MPRVPNRLVLLIIVTTLLGCGLQQRESFDPADSSIEVHFFPKGACTETAVAQVDGANSSILVQTSSLTSVSFRRALIRARERGVSVRVLLNGKHWKERHPSADALTDAGIEVQIDERHTTADKVMILDEGVVVTGGFTCTRTSESNRADNLLVIRDTAVAEQYVANWEAHAEHSKVYSGKGSEVVADIGPSRPAAKRVRL